MYAVGAVPRIWHVLDSVKLDVNMKKQLSISAHGHFLNANFVQNNDEAAGYYLAEKSYSVFNPCFYCSKHSLSKNDMFATKFYNCFLSNAYSFL